MKINTNSWHWSLFKEDNYWKADSALRGYNSLNLCPYVRSVLWSVFKRSLAVGVCTFLALIGLFVFAYLPLAALFNILTGTGISLFFFTHSPDKVIEFGMIILMAELITLLLLFFAKWIYEFSEFMTDRRREKRRQPKVEPEYPNIFKSYLKAHHDKICPMLELDK